MVESNELWKQYKAPLFFTDSCEIRWSDLGYAKAEIFSTLLMRFSPYFKKYGAKFLLDWNALI